MGRLNFPRNRELDEKAKHSINTVLFCHRRTEFVSVTANCLLIKLTHNGYQEDDLISVGSAQPPSLSMSVSLCMYVCLSHPPSIPPSLPLSLPPYLPGQGRGRGRSGGSLIGSVRPGSNFSVATT